jgi:hypothetical protein
LEKPVTDSPVIVIGAGRSGTNLLRDIICSFDGFYTWPCDEINYIWRHGNRSASTDELSPADARPEVVRYIRRAFDKQWASSGGATVVEKTCANSLRVPFVHEVFPDARFVYILRDGRDVVASAIKRWTAPLDLRYLRRKARFVPVVDLPHYAANYVRARLKRIGSSDHAVGTWGPRFSGMDEVVLAKSLAEVCATQWLACVESTERGFDECTRRGVLVHRLRYEDLASRPLHEVTRLAAFLGVTPTRCDELPEIRASSVGRWSTTLSVKEQDAVLPLLTDALLAHGY